MRPALVKESRSDAVWVVCAGRLPFNRQSAPAIRTSTGELVPFACTCHHHRLILPQPPHVQVGIKQVKFVGECVFIYIAASNTALHPLVFTDTLRLGPFQFPTVHPNC